MMHNGACSWGCMNGTHSCASGKRLCNRLHERSSMSAMIAVASMRACEHCYVVSVHPRGIRVRSSSLIKSRSRETDARRVKKILPSRRFRDGEISRLDLRAASRVISIRNLILIASSALAALQEPVQERCTPMRARVCLCIMSRSLWNVFIILHSRFYVDLSAGLFELSICFFLISFVFNSCCLSRLWDGRILLLACLYEYWELYLTWDNYQKIVFSSSGCVRHSYFYME